ncbi:AraC family transcriptional regulator [Gracilibacillus sp. S3-1-1]|uniref:AraC family transcriptional regulator n=1 Tax=Gracilibacillus pellucidus TaxID=3095368 RepID=A0ACC6M5W4_9BACI|nr:AraC family transcriptional regulator [Gracilibacillus sp. S3-1-1]MDX8046232.1 AraC family transcriptional regulator [Gracilibacillus sp. S3-1-1]
MLATSLYTKLFQETEEERAILAGNHAVNKQLYTNTSSGFVIQSEKFLQDNLIMLRKHPRYIHFPRHSHDYIEMNYVFHGQLQQTIADQSITLKQGDIVILNQYIEHELQACHQEDIIINFIIHPDFFDYILSHLSKDFTQNKMVQFLLNSMFHYTQKGEYLHYPVADSARIQDIMQQLLQEMMTPSVFTTAKMKFLIGLLIIELMERNQTKQTTLMSEHHAFLTEVFRYIEENYYDANLQTLSQLVNQTVYSLSKQIKQLTNQNFKDLVQEKRLLVAKQLLMNTELSIQAIAEEIGYENISYFYRLFKKKYQMTPKAYRKQLINID